MNDKYFIFLAVFCLTLTYSKVEASGDWCPFERNAANLCPYTWNANIYLGNAKYLKSSDWHGSNSQQTENGGEVELRKLSWPFYVVFNSFFAEDEYFGDASNQFAVDSRAQTSEIGLGLKKIWQANLYSIAPFIGAGPALMQGSVAVNRDDSSFSDSATALGVWVSSGIYWFFAKNLHAGIALRYSYGEIDLFEQNVDVGGLHIGAFLGYHF